MHFILLGVWRNGRRGRGKHFCEVEWRHPREMTGALEYPAHHRIGRAPQTEKDSRMSAPQKPSQSYKFHRPNNPMIIWDD